METTLAYWNTLANQTLLISSLLSGFSMTIVAGLLVSDKKGKMINLLVRLATIASGSFLVSVFAMTQISMITTPGGYINQVAMDDFVIPRITGVLSLIIGLVSLLTIISLAGWVKSRKTGIFTTIVGIISLLLILSTMVRIEIG